MALLWQRPKNKQTHTATYLNKESISKLTRLKKNPEQTEGEWCKTLVTVLVVHFILNFTSLCVSSQQAKQLCDVINENHCGAVGVFWSVWWLSHHSFEQHFISVFHSVRTKKQKPAVLLLVNAMQCSIWIKKKKKIAFQKNEVKSVHSFKPAAVFLWLVVWNGANASEWMFPQCLNGDLLSMWQKNKCSNMFDMYTGPVGRDDQFTR